MTLSYQKNSLLLVFCFCYQFLVGLSYNSQNPDHLNETGKDHTHSNQPNNKDDYKNAIIKLVEDKEFLEALKLMDSVWTKDKEKNVAYGFGGKCNLFGFIYYHAEDFDTAISYFKKSIDYYKSQQNDARLACSYNHLLECYVKKNDRNSVEATLKTLNSLYQKSTNNQLKNQLSTLKINIWHTYFNLMDYNASVAIADAGLNLMASNADDLVLTEKKLKELRTLFTLFSGLSHGRLSQYDDFYLQSSKLEALDYDAILDDSKEHITLRGEYFHQKARYMKNGLRRIDSAEYYIIKALKLKDTALARANSKIKSNSIYIAQNIEASRALRKNTEITDMNAQLKKYIYIIGFLAAVITLLLVLFALANKRNLREKTKLIESIEQKHQFLKQTVTEKEKIKTHYEQIQATIAADLHDNFGNRLVSIISAHEILKELNDAKIKNTDALKKFLGILENSLFLFSEDIKDLLWANNNENNNLHSIIERIEDYVKELSQKSNVKIDISTDSGITNAELPKFANRQILLILKEAINNSISHSGTQKIAITLEEQKDKTIKFTCQDWGKGFVLDELKYLNGLKLMEKRAETINFKLNIESSMGNGTTIIMTSQKPLKKTNHNY